MKAHTHAERNNAAAIFAILPAEFAYTNNLTFESSENGGDQSGVNINKGLTLTGRTFNAKRFFLFTLDVI